MVYSKGELWAMGKAMGWTVVSQRFFTRCHNARICCPGQHDCSGMINVSKSLPTKQASILIFMSPCGTLASFHFHEKPTFLNSNWFSEGWQTQKTPLDHFFIYWHYVPLMYWKKENKDQVYTRGVGEDAPIHGLERYVPTNRVSFLMVSILK